MDLDNRIEWRVPQKCTHPLHLYDSPAEIMLSIKLI